MDGSEGEMANGDEKRRWVGRYKSRRYPSPPFGGTFDLDLLWPAPTGRGLSGTLRLKDGATGEESEAPAVGGIVGAERVLLTARFGRRLFTLNLKLDGSTGALAGDYDTTEPVDNGAVTANPYVQRQRWCNLV